MRTQPNEPRLQLLVVVCAALVVGPLVTLLLLSLAALVHAFVAFHSPAPLLFALLGAMVLPGPTIVAWVLENDAVRERSPGSALAVALFFLVAAIIALWPFAQAVLELLGIVGARVEGSAERDAWIFGAAAAYCVFVSLGHLRWRRALTKAYS